MSATRGRFITKCPRDLYTGSVFTNQLSEHSQAFFLYNFSKFGSNITSDWLKQIV